MKQPANSHLQMDQIINLKDYPIDQIHQETAINFINQCRQQYLQDGLCILPGFIQPDALDYLALEAKTFAKNAYFCDKSHNAYLTDGNDSPATQAHQHQEKTFVGSVAYDLIDDNSLLKKLYLWDPLKDFIGAVLGKQKLHRLADPFGACSINVFVDGGEHGWHFDESEFTVTLMLNAPEQGGEFEYAPKIRGLDKEQQIVESILNGNREGVIKLPFTPGTLLIFGGNQTIHRVTKVKGSEPRLVPVLCYSEKPDAQNSEAVRQLFWGRTGPTESKSNFQNQL